MFHACQAAARRASSHSRSKFNGTSSATQSSAAAAILLVLVSERHNNEDNATCQEHAEANNDDDDVYNDYYLNNERGRAQSSYTNSHAPYRNFVATSAKCEHISAASHYRSGIMPDHHDLRLRRSVTSKRMAAEKSLRTFFSSYEVEFDDPLGSGKFYKEYCGVCSIVSYCICAVELSHIHHLCLPILSVVYRCLW